MGMKKIPKLKSTKKCSIGQQRTISNKSVAQTKLNSSESMQQSSSQLENYRAFFQYLLSNDDSELIDAS